MVCRCYPFFNHQSDPRRLPSPRVRQRFGPIPHFPIIVVAVHRTLSEARWCYSLSCHRYVVKHALAHLRACALHAPALLREVENNAAFVLARRLQDVAANGMHSFYHHVGTALGVCVPLPPSCVPPGDLHLTLVPVHTPCNCPGQIITREAAEGLLRPTPVGTFLIRWSETMSTFCVSFRYLVVQEFTDPRAHGLASSIVLPLCVFFQRPGED